MQRLKHSFALRILENHKVMRLTRVMSLLELFITSDYIE
jgi:hypothetical protein